MSKRLAIPLVIGLSFAVVALIAIGHRRSAREKGSDFSAKTRRSASGAGHSSGAAVGSPEVGGPENPKLREAEASGQASRDESGAQASGIETKLDSLTELLRVGPNPQDKDQLKKVVEEMEGLLNDLKPMRAADAAELSSRALHERDSATRRALFEALAHIGGPEAVEFLERTARDGTLPPELRGESVTALGYFEPIGFAVTPMDERRLTIMRDLSADPNVQVRERVAYTLGSTPSASSRSILHALVQDDQVRVALAAVKQLELAGDKTTFPILLVAAAKHPRLKAVVDEVGQSLAGRLGMPWRNP
jgi:hypothetical protein